ncbi:MAG: toxic anion resistance protein [Geminicoccaceae bacterium]|nr:MAG: toxic anion resistance protein [Geminicoccaceae bacterium]
MSHEPESVPSAKEPTAIEDQLDVLSAELTYDLQVTLEGDAPAQLQKLKNEIDVSDTNSIIFFGTKAQEQLTQLSEKMLDNVRTKDLGPAGDMLTLMVNRLRELDVSGLDGRAKTGFLARLLGQKNPVERYLDRYETVKDRIENTTIDLERHKTQLLTDITLLDKLYDANLDYFRTLELYIAAGRAKIKELDEELIPAKSAEVDDSEDIVEAQQLRDLRTARDDLERRVHDLMLTRQVTMQSLPAVRLVQENDKSLVTKINSTIANTIPLWKQQLAQAITVYRSGQAAKAVKAATDFTNELLKSNAEQLREANRAVRQEVERGVFDIEAVQQANDQLIATINESLAIADEGKKKRAEAEHALEEMEVELKKTLVAASARLKGKPAVAGRKG